MKNTTKDLPAIEEQLSTDFQDFPLNGKCFQRVVRERAAEQPEADIAEKQRLAADLKSAIVREITFEQARNLVVANEWLGNLPGSTEHCMGIFYGSYLGGVVCFGSTAGTNVKNSICGSEYADRVTTITRGCCCWWGHKHGGSFLISAACREMTKKGYNVFVAYSDQKAANEEGILYRACNFIFCGTTNPTEKFKTPAGKVYDARNVHLLTRDRTGGTLKYKRTRAEQKQLMINEGCEFFKDDSRKLRYVGIFGDRRTKRILRSALKWPVLPYPKRQQPMTIEVPQPDGISMTN